MNKLKIFICEDDDKQREDLESTINEIIFNEDFKMKIKLSTDNPYKILGYIKSNKSICVYFLDVNLNSNITGIELAREIRKYDPDGYIVFITEKNELAYLTFKYEINVIDYIIKDYLDGTKNRIYSCMKKINDSFNTINIKKDKTFAIKRGDRCDYVSYKDILFFETSEKPHKIVLNTINEIIEFYGKLKEVESDLDNRFYRCHKSFLVNKDNIKQMHLKEKKIEMINGSSCLVSRKLIKGLN